MTTTPWEQEARSFFLVELAELIANAEREVLVLEGASDPAAHVNILFRAFHTIKGGAGMLGWQELAHYTNRMENLLSLVRNGTLAVSSRVISVLLESVDCLKGFYQEASNQIPFAKEAIQKSLLAMEQCQNPTVEPPSVPSVTAPPVVEKPAPAPEHHEATIRVGINKLNLLVNLAGEAVTNHSRLRNVVRRLEEVDEALAESLLPILDDNERITRALQEQVNTIRMIPIGSTLNSFQRMVRDYARQSGKEIRLQVVGGETELDKEVIERVSGPLKHLIRNAMDHGIESAEERVARKKPPQGTIQLRAQHVKGLVFIEVSDDGRGLDEAAILASAKSKGLVAADSKLSPDEIRQLLFQPGFSTRTTVSDISGRGVGLDVVKQEVTALHGDIVIRSQPGEGTTFLVQLPLTLAIIDGMLVRVADQIFTIPLLSVVESLQSEDHLVKSIHGRQEVVDVRGEYIPLVRLHRRFNLPPTPCEHPVWIIVESTGRKCCLLVDEMIDQQTVVIKSVEENFIPINDITGATILGDGTLS
ncbi:MAG: chemotaxis protein CheA, partial [Magnetococcales bacterium]|nr:chemotaxis protein CheA [Magnetococcales bacterium]